MKKENSSMVVTVDIGNTNIVIGGYVNDKLCFGTRLYTHHNLEADQYAIMIKGVFDLHKVDSSNISGIIISSVVPQVTFAVTRSFRFLAPGITPIMFNKDIVPDMKIDIDNPAELGADLLSGSVAVKHNFPLPAIVIDMGTATKLTAIDADGAIQGVSIMPGLFISLNALTARASLLEGIGLDAPRCAIGKNTADSMKSGVLLGAASMLDGLIDRFEAELGKVKSIVATGGAVGLVVPHCKHDIIRCSELNLDGLYIAYINHCKNQL